VTGERFSRLYVQPGDPTPDSGRARHRIGALFGETALSQHGEQLAAYLSREIGVPVPGGGRRPSEWRQFIRECHTPDFLDTITVVYRYLFWHRGGEIANWWRDVVKQIFAEESLAYAVDDVAGIHPAVDREFQRNLTTAVTGLQSPHHHGVRDLLESAAKCLSGEPPNYRQAWRTMLSAVEKLFGLMFPYVRLTADEIDRRLGPLVQRAYESDATAQQAARRMLVGLKEWIEASDYYRHRPGADEPPQPPPDIAILAISHGASLLRWLAGINELRDQPTEQRETRA
jgi:hypothetical protein